MIFFWVLLTPVNYAYSKTVIKVAVAQLPNVEKHPKETLFIELLNAMDNQSPDVRIEILEMPFARTLVELARGHVDAQLPVMYDPNDILGATDYMKQFGIKLNDFTYTDENLFRTHFVIVSKEDVEITPENLMEYEVATDMSHVAFFKHQFKGTHSMKAAIANVQRGTLDGYLFDSEKVSQVVRDLDFVDHRLNSFAFYDVRFMVRNDEKGIRIKLLLDQIVAELKESGEFDRVMHDLVNEHGY
ncbi:hypothetical protein MACH26_16540 [Planctobacterium marinum]|uniref:Uncharacterized protein n=2 Tax=Planctobacterium marinum TaxID=1631968 RepID=A0AA48HUJ2_9ALTE|nr:hypothetical protein MACH26_16540 [Planctobacterium marinum]